MSRIDENSEENLFKADSKNFESILQSSNIYVFVFLVHHHNNDIIQDSNLFLKLHFKKWGLSYICGLHNYVFTTSDILFEWREDLCNSGSSSEYCIIACL